MLAGCGGSQTPLAPSAIEGTYVLQTVNGSRLPATISQDASDSVELVAATVFLTSDKFCHIATSRHEQAPDAAPAMASPGLQRDGLVVRGTESRRPP